MEATEKLCLAKKANQIRQLAVTGIYRAKAGHPGGSLSIADTLAYLYFKEMKVDPAQPKWPQRDRLVLSKGHTCPALYAALALKGYFPTEELEHLRQLGALLQGHPDMKHIPGIDMSTGSLGQGISAAVGMALCGKLYGETYRVFAILGDGECEEGQVWEAAMLAGNRKLDNLVAVVDYNNLQIDGTLDEVNSPMPIDEKFKAFGWDVFFADAHDFDSLEKAFADATASKKPAVIVQKSVKGKGVSFMENQAGWHGKAPNDEEYKQAMQELETCAAGLEG
ncbi:MAG: transketolase [Pygmaiobacter massiliensis]|nr:transketolase [Pygmaiobacter massiliensis]